MEYSLGSKWFPKPNQRQDVGMIKVTIKGFGDQDVGIKPGQILMEVALNTILMTGQIPTAGLYWDGVPGHEPCEFVSYDPQNEHLTISFK